jgi:hypothetical protein
MQAKGEWLPLYGMALWVDWRGQPALPVNQAATKSVKFEEQILKDLGRRPCARPTTIRNYIALLMPRIRRASTAMM